MTSLRQRVLDELQRRNYSSETTRGYIHAIKQFADYFGKSPEHLGGPEIRQFRPSRAQTAAARTAFPSAYGRNRTGR